MAAETAAVPPHGTRALWRWLGPALALVFVAAPVVYWHGHAVDEEAVGFLEKNWSERTALQKIFDVRGWDYYQGRELSYAIDYLDDAWVRLLMARGVVLFVPPSAVLSSLAFVWIGASLAPRALPRLPPAWRWLALLLLLSNFVFLTTMGLLYRATKPLVAPLVLALFLLALAEHRRPGLGRRSAFGAGFALALALGLLDRQGLFYVLALLLVLAAAWLRTRRGLALALGAAAGVLCWYVYFRGLGPWLVHLLEGYWPSMRFQQLRLGHLLRAGIWIDACAILGSWTDVLVGSLPMRLIAPLAIGAFALWAWHQRRRPLLVGIVAASAGTVLVAQLTMVAMMVERHPPVAWVSHRLWYYPFVYQAVLVFGLLLALDRLAATDADRIVRFAVPLVLAGLVALNVLRWPEKQAEIESDSSFADKLRRSDLLVRSLQGGSAKPLLDGDHRRFYFDCLDLFPVLASRARPQVSEGSGFLLSQTRGNRVVAAAEPLAHLAARTTVAGRYVLAGQVRLRGGDELQVLLGSPARLVGGVRQESAGEADAPFRAVLELSAGVSDVQLLSSLLPRHVSGTPRHTRTGYELWLPVALWRDSGPGSQDPDGQDVPAQKMAGRQSPR